MTPQGSWREAFSVYLDKRVLGMLFLGFSAGMPFLLVFSTLSAWLKEAGVSLSVIGFFSWVGITYSIKVVWAPVVDRLPIPGLTRLLGRRRSWMLLAQLGIASGLILMAAVNPATHTMQMALFALVVAFSSATQDISIDAYRIEAVVKEYQGAMAAMYIAGYRIALLVSGAGALVISDQIPWSSTYLIMAALMAVGMCTVLLIKEPDATINNNTMEKEQRVIDYLERSAHVPHYLRHSIGWFIGAVICPFTDFFQRNGAMAIVILLVISMFRISDITMGVMANPFYLDLGFSKTEIGLITKVFGLAMTLVGAAMGGLLVVRYGIMRPLLLGASWSPRQTCYLPFLPR